MSWTEWNLFASNCCMICNIESAPFRDELSLKKVNHQSYSEGDVPMSAGGYEDIASVLLL